MNPPVALARMSVQKTVSFPSKVLHSPSISWSNDGRISLCTEECVLILTPQVNVNECSPSMRLHVSRIETANESLEMDTGVIRGAVQHKAVQNNADDLFTLMLDRTISPAIQSMQSFRGYRTAKWSPLGADSVGRSILATLTMDHRLALHQHKTGKRIWTMEVDLSLLYLEHMKTSEFLILETRPAALEGVKSLRTMKERAYSLAAIDMDWSLPFTRDISFSLGLNETAGRAEMKTQIKDQFAVLSVAMKSGHVVLWRVSLPLSGSEDCRYVATKDIAKTQPSSIYWCQVYEHLGFVVLGLYNGMVKAFVVRYCIDTDVISTGECTDLWKDIDSVPVTAICWNKRERILAVAKGPFLFAFEVQTKSKSMEVAVVRSNHVIISDCLPINCLWHNGGMVHVSVEDGKLFAVKICKEQGLKIEHYPINVPHEGTAWKSHGLCTSPNRIFLACVESPSGFYCHLTVKNPLKLHIINLRTRKDVLELIMDQKEDNLGHLSDALIYIKQLFTQEESLPCELHRLVAMESDWPDCSSYYLKLIRFLLKFQFTYDNKGTSPADSQGVLMKISLLEDLIIKKHVWASLSTLLSSIYQLEHLTSIEKASAFLMCDWLMQKDYFSDGKLSETVREVREKLQESPQPVAQDTIPSREICRICAKEVPLVNVSDGSCQAGHKAARCCQTLLLCQGSSYQICEVCGTFSTIKATSGMKWLASTKDECIYCDGRLL